MYEVQFSATDSADWTEAVEIIDADTGHPFETDADFELVVRDRKHVPLLKASTLNGTIERPALSVIRWRFTPEQMRVLRHNNTYNIGITMTTEEGVTQVLIGSVAFLDGVVAR